VYVVDGLERTVGADEDGARIDVDPGDVLIGAGKVEAGRRFDDPIEHLGAHIAEQQIVRIGLAFAHVHFVTDTTRRAWEKSGFEHRALEIFLPDAGHRAQIAICTAAFAGRHDNVDVARWKISGEPALRQAKGQRA